jgi:inner membrane protein
LLGIVLHIFFDLITSFGTQILAPLSDTRYKLDWIFIIDPWFTMVLAILLLLGKLMPARARIITSGSLAFVVVYVIASAITHNSALFKLYHSSSKLGISWTRLSALPQPLSLFRWNGLVQMEEGVLQTFYSVFDDSLQFRIYPHARDEFVDRAIQNPEMKWYMNIARHPSIRSFEDGAHHVVEVRDLMFSVDDALLKSLGFTERSLPFSLTCVYDSSGTLLEESFDGKRIGGEK